MTRKPSRAKALNLDVARSSHVRLISAEKVDCDEVPKLECELARVDEAIETQSEGAVKEKLAEVMDRLEKAMWTCRA
ncbi:MAG: hypothetical protein ABJ360_19380 [Roseobacter sp.]